MPRNASDIWQQAVSSLRGGLTSALVFSFALNLLMLAVPLYSMQIYDRVLGSGRIETLVLLSMIAALALAALGAFEAVRSSLLARTASRFEQILAEPVVVAAAALQPGSGAVGLRELAHLRQALTGPAMTALFDAPWLPLALLVLWFVHPVLGSFAAASAVALAMLAVANDVLTRRAQRLAGRTQSEAQLLTDAMARKPEAVLAMGMLDTLAGRIGRLHAASLVAQQSATERGGMVMGVTRSLRLFVQIGVMGLGAWLVLRNELTPGAMLASSILVSKALAPVEQMVGMWKTVGGARDSWRRLRELLAAKVTTAARVSLPPALGRLTVEQVTVHGQNGRALLQDVSFELEPGDCLAVVGPSGAGKSTLARLLTGVMAPSAGAVRLDGAQLDHYPLAELGRQVGYLPQEAMLFAGTVAENIARMAEQPDAAAVVAAAQLAGAHEMILRLSDGYATRLADGGAPLSGGQRQRLGLARAVFGETRLVVLDEPNAHLDGSGEAALTSTLARLKQAGATIILITHRAQALQRADKVLVLEDGKISRFGHRDSVLPTLIRPARAA